MNEIITKLDEIEKKAESILTVHRFLRCFLRGLLLYFFFFLLCHVCDLLSICRVGENLRFLWFRGFSPALPV